MTLNIDVVIAQAKAKRIIVNKKSLAAMLWQGSSENTQQVNMTNLCTGRTDRLKIEWIETICKTCKCTPNELLGYEEDNKKDSRKRKGK